MFLFSFWRRRRRLPALLRLLFFHQVEREASAQHNIGQLLRSPWPGQRRDANLPTYQPGVIGKQENWKTENGKRETESGTLCFRTLTPPTFLPPHIPICRINLTLIRNLQRCTLAHSLCPVVGLIWRLFSSNFKQYFLYFYCCFKHVNVPPFLQQCRPQTCLRVRTSICWQFSNARPRWMAFCTVYAEPFEDRNGKKLEFEPPDFRIVATATTMRNCTFEILNTGYNVVFFLFCVFMFLVFS